MVSNAAKMLNKLYAKYDVNKILKEYLKLCISASAKIRS